MSQIVTQDGFSPDPFDMPIPTLDLYDGGAAVLLQAGEDPDTLGPHLGALRLIVVAVDSFADGRGFSIAARLRQSGYDGHLRARGPVLVDQFRAALRVGFDDIEISAARAQHCPEGQWLAVPHGADYRSRVFAARDLR